MYVIDAIVRQDRDVFARTFQDKLQETTGYLFKCSVSDQVFEKSYDFDDQSSFYCIKAV